jgi:beta-glucosidase
MRVPTPQSLLAQMTLEEKIAQIGSLWMHEIQDGRNFSSIKAGKLLQHGIGQITRTAGDSTLEPAAVAKFNNALQNYLGKHTRLGIPAIVHEECCAGLMALGATVFPQMLGLAASWKPELAEKMTAAIRLQARAVGAHQSLAPVLDVARDPRWGRCEETFGEDPLLVSQFGMAFVRGLQGATLKDGVMATGKHFIGHSLSQGGLNCNPVRVGWREIWDVSMMPFQAAISETHIASIMNAYPEIDGEVVAASPRILTNILREKLGFTGLVVSDYDAILMIHNFHYLAAGETEAGMMALAAGIDVELPSRRCYGEGLKAALEAGEFSLENLDTAVERVLRKKVDLGLFENPYVDEGRVLEVYETPSQRDLARQLAEKSLTLLKNDGNTLPLSKTVGKLAVIGPNADSPRALHGDYSYIALADLRRNFPTPESSFDSANFSPDHMARFQTQVTSILAGIRAAVPQVEVLYARGCNLTGDDRSGFDEAVGIAKQAAAVVLVLGDRSGLTLDATSGETRDSSTLHLPAIQEELLKVVAATGKPVIVVLLSGRVIALAEVSALASAILEAWVPGEEGGAAVAAALFGDVNPGGKLPISFPRSVGQVPVYYNHKASAGRSNWYGPYVNEATSPLYPFGHGLSYTSFEYSELSISQELAQPGTQVEISLKLRNIGERSGEETVQLYIRDVFASSPQPVRSLKGFVRVALNPGQACAVTFKLPVDLLAYYDQDLKLVVESGKIDIFIGSSSEDIRLNGSFEIGGKGKTFIEKRLFDCPVFIKE